MATYDNRIRELRELILQATAGVDESVVRLLTQAIDKYADLRQRALDDLVEIVARASISNLGTQARWDSRIRSLRSEYNRVLVDAGKDAMPPPSVERIWSTLLQEEEMFFVRLSEIETPQLLDDILKHQDALSKLAGELKDAWNFLLSNDKNLENDEIRAIRQVDEMVKGIVSDLVKRSNERVERLGRLAEAVARASNEFDKKIEELKGPGGVLASAVVALAKIVIVEFVKPDSFREDFDTQFAALIQSMKLSGESMLQSIRLYRSDVQTYQNLLSTEKGGVLTLFKKRREDVDTYIKTNNLAIAREWRDKAVGKLDDWVSALPTSRQRDDAELFSKEISEHLERDFELTEELDQKFREEFQGVFVSPLSNETIETLAEKFLFKQHLEAIKDQRGDAKLEEFRALLPEHTQDMEEGLKPLENVVEDLPSEVREFAQLRHEEFRKFVREQMRRHVEALLPHIEELKSMLEPSNMEDDFSREEVETMLR